MTLAVPSTPTAAPGAAPSAAVRMAQDAGFLLRYGLLANASGQSRAIDERDLRRLVDEYQASPPFREVVRATASGLGLIVVAVNHRGVVLSASAASPFAITPADFRGNSTADDRLLDGLIQVAIAATVFPRAQALDEDPAVLRSPVTVDEVLNTLQDLSERLAHDTRDAPDPATADVRAGLIEAWRIYRRRSAAAKTPDDRGHMRSTRRMIERNIEALRDHGCFRETRKSVGGGMQDAFQPTWRYQVHLAEFAATELYALVADVLERPAGTAPPAATPTPDA